MATTLETKSRRPVKKPTKLCLKCRKPKELPDFYTNRDWEEQLGKDVWCKECVSRCSTKDELREYFWENHREWTDRLWDSAMKKAEGLANKNETFMRSTEERRAMILEKLTCQQAPSLFSAFYKYVEHERNGVEMSYQDAKENGMIEDSVDANLKVYSKEFNGNFKPQELSYLENYYQSLENDFDLDTENLRDYARKLAKASLQADKAQDDYGAGKCDYSVVKDAQAQFDMLSKSANFAACKRKPGEGGGMGSWSELTYKLETSGYPCTRKIEWEKDDVDRTIMEFRHIIDALGLDMV